MRPDKQTTESQRQANLRNWNDRVAIHWESDEYGIQRFIDDPDHISRIVDFDRQLVEPVEGQTLLHLLCHLGTDTLSWARLGAVVTGVDFSDKAIAAGKELSRTCGTPGRFIEAEFYETPSAVDEQFDIVYTGVGAICWLPDISAWGRVVADCLRPGGTFYIRDGHPAMSSMDWTDEDGPIEVGRDYFGSYTPIVSQVDESYAGEGTLENQTTYTYTHGLGETINALLNAGLVLEFVNEHTFSEWRGIAQLVEGTDGRWRLPPAGEKHLPLMFSIRARKPD